MSDILEPPFFELFAKQQKALFYKNELLRDPETTIEEMQKADSKVQEIRNLILEHV